MGLLLSIKRKMQGDAHVRVIFQGGPPFDRVALDMLKWTLNDRGVELTEEVMSSAELQSEMNPWIKVGAFVDGIVKRRSEAIWKE